MFKLLLPLTLTLAATAFGISNAEAKGGCRFADDLLPGNVQATNKEIAKAANCLAGSLSPKDVAPTEKDAATAEKIIILASKIIGNGSPKDQKALIGAGGKTAAASLAGGQKTPTTEDVVQAAQKSVCLAADHYLGARPIDTKLLANKGTCSSDEDAKQGIILAFKIIGNG